MKYNFNKKVNGRFKEIISKVTDALKKEGFGVITEINLQEKFKEKFNIDFRRYTILGACNPKLAYEAIQQEPNVGVMLPCNILVQETVNDEIEIAAINPLASIGALQNKKLESLANAVSDKLKTVIDGIQ